uniref:Uncharacterized protein n=1 Tax=Ditylenchus dipsaci TaxID=166011 RepID=A0A915CP16_9BILA
MDVFLLFSINCDHHFSHSHHYAYKQANGVRIVTVPIPPDCSQLTAHSSMAGCASSASLTNGATVVTVTANTSVIRRLSFNSLDSGMVEETNDFSVYLRSWACHFYIEENSVLLADSNYAHGIEMLIVLLYVWLNNNHVRDKRKELDQELISADDEDGSKSASTSVSVTDASKQASDSSINQEEELRKKAAETLVREAQRSSQRADRMGPQGWLKPRPLNTNKNFLSRTLQSVEISRRDLPSINKKSN